MNQPYGQPYGEPYGGNPGLAAMEILLAIGTLGASIAPTRIGMGIDKPRRLEAQAKAEANAVTYYAYGEDPETLQLEQQAKQQAKRQKKRERKQQKQAEAEAAALYAASTGMQPPTPPMDYTPWLFGGVAIFAALGGAAYFMTKGKRK